MTEERLAEFQRLWATAKAARDALALYGHARDGAIDPNSMALACEAALRSGPLVDAFHELLREVGQLRPPSDMVDVERIPTPAASRATEADAEAIKRLQQEVERLREENRRLQANVANVEEKLANAVEQSNRLRETLRPFASLAVRIADAHPHYDDETPFIPGWKTGPTLGDCRRAQAALAAK